MIFASDTIKVHLFFGFQGVRKLPQPTEGSGESFHDTELTATGCSMLVSRVFLTSQGR
jgi:hypothetical protein